MRAFNAYAQTDAARDSRCCWSSSTARSRASPSRRSRFGEIVADNGGGNFIWATKPEERTKLWQARHDGFWAQMTLRPGARPFATDTCVPISRLADCVEETLEDIAATGLVAPIVGHVGDGNFHVSPLVDMTNPHEIEAAEAFASRLAHRAIAMGGTCTGEHGIGQKKIAYMEDEHGRAGGRPDAPGEGGLRSAEPVQSGQGVRGVAADAACGRAFLAMPPGMGGHKPRAPPLRRVMSASSTS